MTMLVVGLSLLLCAPIARYGFAQSGNSTTADITGTRAQRLDGVCAIVTPPEVVDNGSLVDALATLDIPGSSTLKAVPSEVTYGLEYDYEVLPKWANFSRIPHDERRFTGVVLSRLALAHARGRPPGELPHHPGGQSTAPLQRLWQEIRLFVALERLAGYGDNGRDACLSIFAVLWWFITSPRAIVHVVLTTMTLAYCPAIIFALSCVISAQLVAIGIFVCVFVIPAYVVSVLVDIVAWSFHFVCDTLILQWCYAAHLITRTTSVMINITICANDAAARNMERWVGDAHTDVLLARGRLAAEELWVLRRLWLGKPKPAWVRLGCDDCGNEKGSTSCRVACSDDARKQARRVMPWRARLAFASFRLGGDGPKCWSRLVAMARLSKLLPFFAATATLDVAELSQRRFFTMTTFALEDAADFVLDVQHAVLMQAATRSGRLHFKWSFMHRAGMAYLRLLVRISIVLRRAGPLAMLVSALAALPVALTGRGVTSPSANCSRRIAVLSRWHVDFIGVRRHMPVELLCNQLVWVRSGRRAMRVPLRNLHARPTTDSGAVPPELQRIVQQRRVLLLLLLQLLLLQRQLRLLPRPLRLRRLRRTGPWESRVLRVRRRRGSANAPRRTL